MEKVKYFLRAEQIFLSHGGKAFSRQAFSCSYLRGNVVFVLGENGAGKTTFLEAILGEKKILSGNIFLFDKLLSQWRGDTSLFSYVPQVFHLSPMLRGESLLRLSFFAQSRLFDRISSDSEAWMRRVICQLKLEPFLDRYVSHLSPGEKKQLLLASALLKQPKILLLDEPTSFLDPIASLRFWRALFAYQKEFGFEIVIATHDLECVRQWADVVLVLERGAKIFDGTRDEFFGFKDKWLLS